MKTRMISAMKHVKDRMGNPMAVAEMNQLLDVYKSAGATHVEVATVMGHNNFLPVSEQWADAIHDKGMKVTWRCAHQNMEGLYGAEKFVGSKRRPTQFWIDEAVKAARDLGTTVQTGDEWAIYPERTEGVFNDSTAWIAGGLPGSYADFFIAMHNSCKAALPQGVLVGLSANNASELLSGWMPRSLTDTFEVAVIDHYVDGDPAKYEQYVRSIKAKYGVPVYVQEGAPHRFQAPSQSQCDAYYTVNKKLADEGILAAFGSWSGWTGTPESIVDEIDGKYVLNTNGLSLQSWWKASSTPTPTPDPVPPTPSIVIGAEEPYKAGYKTYYRNLTIDGKLVGKIKVHRK